MSRHVYPTVYVATHVYAISRPHLGHRVGRRVLRVLCARSPERDRLTCGWLLVMVHGVLLQATTAHNWLDNSVIHPVNAKSCVREQ